MRKPFAALFLFLLPLMANSGQVRIVSDIPGAAGGPTDTEVLQYDDGTPGEHSYFSDDFVVWESWGDMGDYFIRAHGGYTLSLEETTWGAVKVLF